MARRHSVAVAAAALLVTVLAACDGAGSDNPSKPPATASFPTDGVHDPVVPNPLNATAFVKKPCASLTREQQRKYELDAGEASTVSTGAKCVYKYTGSDRTLQIDYNTNQGGLQGPAEVRLQPGVRWVTEIVDNYPAVAEYGGPDPNEPGCYYSLGLNDDVYVGVLLLHADGGQECTVARQIATDVLSNIKKRR